MEMEMKLEFETPCQRPGWFEDRLAAMPPYLAAAVKLHPDVLNDFAAPRIRLFPADELPRVIAVVYANGLYAHSWIGETLVQASNEDFGDMVRSLPKSW